MLLSDESVTRCECFDVQYAEKRRLFHKQNVPFRVLSRSNFVIVLNFGFVRFALQVVTQKIYQRFTENCVPEFMLQNV